MVNQLMQTAAIRAAGAHDLPAHLDITHQDEPLTQSHRQQQGRAGANRHQYSLTLQHELDYFLKGFSITDRQLFVKPGLEQLLMII